MLAKKAGKLKKAETNDRSGADLGMHGPPRQSGGMASVIKTYDDAECAMLYPWCFVLKKGHVLPNQEFAEARDLDYTFAQVIFSA